LVVKKVLGQVRIASVFLSGSKKMRKVSYLRVAANVEKRKDWRDIDILKM